LTPRKISCEVGSVIDHGAHVYSALLRPRDEIPRFLPGQFLHLALDPYRPGDFWPESRVFSIASPPSERSLLRITYAVKGRFTARMEAELGEGKEVWVKLPYGEFTVDKRTDACLVAGGTGVTAFAAFLAELPANHPHQVALFYGARTPDLLVYQRLAREATERCRTFQAHYFAEAGVDGAVVQAGRLDLDTVWPLIPNPGGMTYYVSGPPEMLSAYRDGLAQRGVDSGHVAMDAWE
jgi:ferredoxin-NADP reductase